MPSSRTLQRSTALLAALSILVAVCIDLLSRRPLDETFESFADLDPTILRSSAPIESLDDARVRHLMEASQNWRTSRGPAREVVDQVVLVADLPSFYAAVSAWDDHSFFPILIDDPHWTPQFVRAFKPARIVRLRSTRKLQDNPIEVWNAAQEAVGRAWVDDEADATPPPSGARPQGIEAPAPGVVLSHPDSRSLAGAVALAAGRFQPLIRLEPITSKSKSGKERRLGFDDAASEAQAIDFARHLESRVASISRNYRKLGDEVDFLTLADDWPYRYECNSGSTGRHGARALDDLVGRVLPRREFDIDSALVRWAYAGRLLGDPAASVYRAMASLFLQPETAMFWNTYGGESVWGDYETNGAARLFGFLRPAPGAVEARGGSFADLTAWHEVLQPVSRYDLLMVTSSGSASHFSISGGPGVSADVPFGPPTGVVMIHSFSAENPTNPATIAGRFLERGAFLYHGSMNEPYLTAFRTPYLLSQLLAAETPMGAVCRQGPYEAFGHPWRLSLLGDPLFHLDPAPPGFRAARSPATERVWRGAVAESVAHRDPPQNGDPSAMLTWCYDAALTSLVQSPPASEAETQTESIIPILTSLDRKRLTPDRRVVLDTLLIDQLLASGDERLLFDQLWEIPPNDRSPLVWRALETLILNRVASLIRAEGFQVALDFWSSLVVAPWRSDAKFLGVLTHRLALEAQVDPSRRLEPFRRSLTEVRDHLGNPEIYPARRSMIIQELSRLSDPTTGR